MTPEKQISFIERVNKSVLGLEGLQIVVYCDRNRTGELTQQERKECTFLELGKDILSKINGEYIKQKYDVEDGIEIGKKMHQERVEYIKRYKNKGCS